jgi:hypothetical protein
MEVVGSRVCVVLLAQGEPVIEIWVEDAAVCNAVIGEPLDGSQVTQSVPVSLAMPNPDAMKSPNGTSFFV